MDKLRSIKEVVRNVLLTFCLISLGTLASVATDADTLSIKQLVRQMGDTLVRGNYYRINYSITDKRTDAFYVHYQQLINLFQDNHAEALRNLRYSSPPGVPTSPEQVLADLIKGYKRHLTDPREYSSACDYSLDSVGFVFKELDSWTDSKGTIGQSGPTVYASDGKIMGTFYLDDEQAVIQPSTERPQVASEYWSDAAYLILKQSLYHFVGEMKTLTMAQNESEYIITGEMPGEKKEMTQIELHIGKASLLPTSMEIVYYGSLGKLDSKQVKTWHYQSYSGMSLPKTVIDQSYQTDIYGNLKLEQERTFTINEFSTDVASAKERFHGLLKSNFSVYDEITGSHYMTGNPEEMLDKLSR